MPTEIERVTIFVYGSLRSGEAAHHHLKTASFLGEMATAARYTLFDLGPYPAVAEGGEHAIRGELYLVDPATLAALDEYEGHPELFRRAAIALADGRTVAGYLMTRARASRGRVVPGGDWRRR